MNLIQSIPVQQLKELRASLDLSSFKTKINEIKENNIYKFADSQTNGSNLFKSINDRRFVKGKKLSEGIFNKFDNVNKSVHSIDSQGSKGEFFQKRLELLPVQKKYDEA